MIQAFIVAGVIGGIAITAVYCGIYLASRDERELEAKRAEGSE